MEETKDITQDNEKKINNEEVTSLVGDSLSNDLGLKNEKTEKQIDFKLDHLNLSKSNIINILEDLRVIKKRFNHIENIIKEAERAQYSPSRDLPGVNGIFNGEVMVSSDGVKYDVPKNYSAKSLLVNGDELKMMEQDGKIAFKIVSKVPRKKIEGLLSKKDGRYVILSDSGAYNLSKTAVEFRNIKQGEWVLAVIPETGSANSFAAIDKVIKKENKKEVKFFDKNKQDKNHQAKQTVSINSRNESKPASPNPQTPTSKPQNQTQPHSILSTKVEQPKPQTPTPSPMPKIQFSDDDLV